MQKMFKKVLAGMLTVCMVAGLGVLITPMTTHANPNINVTINGIQVTFTDQHPVIRDGRTLVPVAEVFRALDFDVQWDGATQQATLTRGTDIVVVTVGSRTFTVNGATHTLDVPAQIINGRTMLPIAPLLQSLGYPVNWDAATQTVEVTGTTILAPISAGPTIPAEPTPPSFAPPANITTAEDFYDIVERHPNGLLTVRTDTGELVTIAITDQGRAALREMGEVVERTGLAIGVQTLVSFQGIPVTNPEAVMTQGGAVPATQLVTPTPIDTRGGIVEIHREDGSRLGNFMIGDNAALSIIGFEDGERVRITLIEPPNGFTLRQFVNDGTAQGVNSRGQPYVYLNTRFGHGIGPIFTLITG